MCLCCEQQTNFNMAKSKYEYVREFESATDHKLLPDSFIVVRVDGQCFHRFSKVHNFWKPNDMRCLDLMTRSALHVMRSYYPNIIMAYGQSDEYSFVLRRLAKIFNRRQNKITSLITSTFTSAFIFYWTDFFSSGKNFKIIPSNHSIRLDQPLNGPPPSFDGRCVIYPNESTLMDYLKWRQVDCHVNNLYNTTFHALCNQYTRYTLIESNQYKVEFPIFPSHFTAEDATKKLSKTSSGDKNEILFSTYGINYNNELEQFKKGTIITLNLEAPNIKNIKAKLNNNSEIETSIAQSLKGDMIEDHEIFQVQHIDIISESFWQKYGFNLMKF